MISESRMGSAERCLGVTSRRRPLARASGIVGLAVQMLGAARALDRANSPRLATAPLGVLFPMRPLRLQGEDQEVLMKRTRRALVVSMTTASLCLSGAGAALAQEDMSQEEAQEQAETASESVWAQQDWLGMADRGASITADLLLLRPLGALRSAVGAVSFLPTAAIIAPYSAFTGNWDEFEAVTDMFIWEPTDYTFQRPLGVDLAGR